MADKREAILDRLVAVCESMPGVAVVYRNIADHDDARLPAFVVLDGDEESDGSENNRKRPAYGPRVMRMTPQVFFTAKASRGENIGTTLNNMRAAFVKAVLTDSELLELCHDGEIEFNGFVTDLAAGRTIFGRAGFDFTFCYVLRADKL